MSRQHVIWAIDHQIQINLKWLEGMHRAKAPRESILEMELCLENMRMVIKWIRDTKSPDQVHRVITPKQIADGDFNSKSDAQRFTRAPYRRHDGT